MTRSSPSFWRWVLLSGALLQPLLPLYWGLVTSFRQGADLFSTVLFAKPSSGNYTALLSSRIWWHDAANSLISATSATGLTLALAIPAAFALGRLSFYGRKAVLALLLGWAMLPQITVLSGLFTIISKLGLYNHLGSLIFADLFFTLPFAIWLLAGFFRDLPRDLDDAGKLDGCGMAQRLLLLHLPLVWPGIAATGLLTFINCWNEFLFGLTFTLSDSAHTLPVSLSLISAPSRFELPFGIIMAASLLGTLPPILLVLFFQRRITAGLTAGAVK